MKNLSMCRKCGEPFKPSEVKRVYGRNSDVYQLKFCSAKCFTDWTIVSDESYTLRMNNKGPFAPF